MLPPEAYMTNRQIVERKLLASVSGGLVAFIVWAVIVALVFGGFIWACLWLLLSVGVGG